ncbi:DUF4423 domain-containing protein [Bacteriovorax sp. DB6_IX]|uniref:DUF4423 domain-containing protein n=1 Tax=Bacteriovorax sp. DB6_IX TaxID=1353530 RepID=UPI000389F5E5|nr:DUF4423 domain-containing protein [Bacteriovorax sp. DB6_IX]EQC50709.1 TIGR02147 family protein [Bacteriovorax sp. DB6_IX]
MSYTSELLNTHLELRKQRNIHYSLRAFARDLDVNRNSLSKSMSDQAKLGPKSCEKLREALELNEIEYLKLLFDNGIRFADEAIKEIDPKTFETINNLKNFTILSLLQNHSINWTVDEIHQRVDFSLDEVKKILNGLVEKELLDYDGKYFTRVYETFRTTSNISSQSIRSFHRENLERAIDCIENVDMELRDLSAISFITTKDNIPKIKEEIKNFRRKLGQLAYDKQGEDVYSVSISLHPLTKSHKDASTFNKH